jgi:predicted flap endonuclease-1-like 5' DNA nuclease
MAIALSVRNVEGIGEAYGGKLMAAGIKTAGDLLIQCGTTQGREAVAAKTGLRGGLILQWVQHVDLFRVKGVAGQYAELLEAAGIRTVAELARLTPENLLPKLGATNSARKLVRKLPARSQVEAWVAQARALPRAVHD